MGSTTTTRSLGAARRSLSLVPDLVVVAAAAPMAIVNGYLALVTAAACVRARRPEQPQDHPPSARVAVLIPAHDEESIIGSTIDSVLRQGHPADLISVHVVADNCTDRTAEVARRHGARVHERSRPDQPGKGPALAWLIGRLTETGTVMDLIVILDADTTMAPGFLSAIDACLRDGRVAWQAYYAVRDPDLSASVGLRHAALALRHYVRPLGRTALGGSSGLFGNGMVFRPELLRDRRFSAHLTEDIEFQLELLLDGHLVGFLPLAVVEAEMPSTFAAARTQNARWELGRLQLARRFVPQLARRAVRRGAPHRAAMIDAAFDQVVPPLSVLGVGTVGVAAVALARSIGRRNGGRLGAVLAFMATAGFAFHVIGGMRLARVPRSVYLALLQAPRLVAWKVALWLRVILRPETVSWTRTARNRS